MSFGTKEDAEAALTDDAQQELQQAVAQLQQVISAKDARYTTQCEYVGFMGGEHGNGGVRWISIGDSVDGEWAVCFDALLRMPVGPNSKIGKSPLGTPESELQVHQKKMLHSLLHALNKTEEYVKRKAQKARKRQKHTHLRGDDTYYSIPDDYTRGKEAGSEALSVYNPYGQATTNRSSGVDDPSSSSITAASEDKTSNSSTCIAYSFGIANDWYLYHKTPNIMHKHEKKQFTLFTDLLMLPN